MRERERNESRKKKEKNQQGREKAQMERDKEIQKAKKQETMVWPNLIMRDRCKIYGEMIFDQGEI